jgi:hypothetical protein
MWRIYLASTSGVWEGATVTAEEFAFEPTANENFNI